jgi:pyruvate formate lyase activating enzyme
MIVGGFQKFSLVDFPGLASAIVFTRGCNFACGFCHNPELVDPGRFTEPLDIEETLRFLDKRKKQLGGVVVSGGEPTIHPNLPDFLSILKKMGYLLKLDTNGSNPGVLSKLFEKYLIDFVAMDIKGPLPAYQKITRSPIDPTAIAESIHMILAQGTKHEFRTTYLEQILSFSDLLELGELVRGCSRFVIQPFIPTKALDANLLHCARPTECRLIEIQEALTRIDIPCIIR